MAPVSNVLEDEPIATAWGNDVADSVNALEASVAALTFPPGLIAPYGGAAAPTGWLLCDGSAVSRTTYAALFSVVSTAYGVGNGTSTFNLPDLRGRFPLGVATSGTGSTRGGTGGAIDHVHAGAAHTHPGPSHTHTGPGHAHELPFNVGANYRSQAASDFGTGASVPGVRNINSVADTTAFNRALTENVTGGATGASGTASSGAATAANSGNANAPFQAVSYIIRT